MLFPGEIPVEINPGVLHVHIFELEGDRILERSGITVVELGHNFVKLPMDEKRGRGHGFRDGAVRRDGRDSLPDHPRARHFGLRARQSRALNRG